MPNSSTNTSAPLLPLLGDAQTNERSERAQKVSLPPRMNPFESNCMSWRSLSFDDAVNYPLSDDDNEGEDSAGESPNSFPIRSPPRLGTLQPLSSSSFPPPPPGAPSTITTIRRVSVPPSVDHNTVDGLKMRSPDHILSSEDQGSTSFGSPALDLPALPTFVSDLFVPSLDATHAENRLKTPRCSEEYRMDSDTSGKDDPNINGQNEDEKFTSFGLAIEKKNASATEKLWRNNETIIRPIPKPLLPRGHKMPSSIGVLPPSLNFDGGSDKKRSERESFSLEFNKPIGSQQRESTNFHEALPNRNDSGNAKKRRSSDGVNARCA